MVNIVPRIIEAIGLIKDGLDVQAITCLQEALYDLYESGGEDEVLG